VVDPVDRTFPFTFHFADDQLYIAKDERDLQFTLTRLCKCYTN